MTTNAEYMRKWRAKNKPKVKRMNKQRQPSLRDKLASARRSAHRRAANLNLDFNITTDYLVGLYGAQDGKCALTGRQLTVVFGKGKTSDAVSVDRIVPAKGYVVNNIQLLCWEVNKAKSNLTNEQFISFCKEVICNSMS